MKSSFAIIFLAIMALMACKPAEMAYTSGMVQDMMPVQGRNGLQIGQIIRYGEFTTDKVRRGWTKGYDIPFILRFQGAKEKLSFTQFGPDDQRAEVACISKFKSVEMPLIRDYFSVPLNMKNYFAGTVITDEGQTAWDFILYNPDGDFLKDRPTAGYLRNGTDIISIQPVRGLEGQPKWMKKTSVSGHEFLLDGTLVALVSIVNKGSIWLDPKLDPQLQTVIAAVATGMLLRTDVETAATS